MSLPNCFNGTKSKAASYTCIFCHSAFDSTSACRKHLKASHVAPRTYNCESCGAPFSTKDSAKLHAQTCGDCIWLYMAERAQSKWVYACEFTGQAFSSKGTYLEHLLQLSEDSDAPGKDEKPHPRTHKKLTALLNAHERLRSTISAINKRLHGDRKFWLHLPRSHSEAQSVINDLETGFPFSRLGTVGWNSAPDSWDLEILEAYLSEMLTTGKRPVLPIQGSAHRLQPPTFYGEVLGWKFAV